MSVWPKKGQNRLHVFLEPKDGEGRFVKGASKDDFKVEVDGNPGKIVQFNPLGFAGHQKFAAVIVLDARPEGFQRRRSVAADLAAMLSPRDGEKAQLLLVDGAEVVKREAQTGGPVFSGGIRAEAPGKSSSASMLKGIGEATKAASELPESRPAVFVVSGGPGEAGGSLVAEAGEKQAPIYVLHLGAERDTSLDSLASNSGGGSFAPEGKDLGMLASQAVTAARATVANQYILIVEPTTKIGDTLRVRIGWNSPSGVVVSEFSNLSPLATILPIAAGVLLLLGSLVLYASYRRVQGMLQSGNYDPSRPLVEQMYDSTGPLTASQKVMMAADRVTSRFVRATDDPTMAKGKMDQTVRKPQAAEAPTSMRPDSDGSPPYKGPASLKVETGPLAGTAHKVETALTLGRAEGDLILRDGTVSKRHARVAFEGGALIVEDLGSTNGTLLNGHPVSKANLKPGDLLEIGDTKIRVLGGGDADDAMLGTAIRSGASN